MDDDFGSNGKRKPKTIVFDDDDEPDEILTERKPCKPYNPYDLTLDYYRKGDMYNMMRFFLTYINPTDFLKYAKETLNHLTYVDFIEKLIIWLGR